MAKTVCDHQAKFNQTGTIPEPVKDKGPKEYCGWFKKADDGDSCAGSNVHFWACKSQASTNGGKQTASVNNHKRWNLKTVKLK